ncbi:MAG: hypothetical protein SCK70_00735 [bacterium]|nr:hypothetical protein [bacterium]
MESSNYGGGLGFLFLLRTDFSPKLLNKKILLEEGGLDKVTFFSKKANKHN